MPPRNKAASSRSSGKAVLEKAVTTLHDISSLPPELLLRIFTPLTLEQRQASFMTTSSFSFDECEA